jgi:hypothetical protein
MMVVLYAEEYPKPKKQIHHSTDHVPYLIWVQEQIFVHPVAAVPENCSVHWSRKHGVVRWFITYKTVCQFVI